MSFRVTISIIACILGIIGAQAQTERKDSTLLKKETREEMKLNRNAVNSIDFNFMPQTELPQNKPMMNQEKSWMQLRKDLPKDFTGKEVWKKQEYTRATPYTPYTRHDEDPIYDRLQIKDSLSIRMKINTEKITRSIGMGYGFRIVPEGMDQSVTPSNRPAMGFDAEKALYETFTKRGRAIKRNRKKAKAWKTYEDYVPTKEDSLILDEQKKRIPQDTLILKVDSTNHFMNTK